MAWDFFAVIDASDDDSALYPVLSGPTDALPIALEPLDGTNPSCFTATEARVLGRNGKGQLTETVTLPGDLHWDVVVTDARVIVYCVKFDKGGGWGGFGIGGLAFAVAANAVSKARAASRRKGKVLVAQVRYPWIERVIATPRVDWRTRDRLRIQVNAAPSGDGRLIVLEVVLPKQGDALWVANDLARRAARFRLAYDRDMGTEVRMQFELLATSNRREPVPPTSARNPTWAEYVMPSNYRVNVATAFPSQ